MEELDSKFLLDQIAATDIYTFISFGERRMKRQKVLKILPELMLFEEFGKLEFTSQMEAHNSTVRRGMQMGLIKHFDASRLLFKSDAAFMLQFHSEKLAQALMALCTFGERIAPKALSDPEALFWVICEDLMITSDQWDNLSRHMARIASMLRRALDCPIAELWPGRRPLELTTSRTLAIFVAVCPQLPDLHSQSHPNGRDGRNRLLLHRHLLRRHPTALLVLPPPPSAAAVFPSSSAAAAAPAAAIKRRRAGCL